MRISIFILFLLIGHVSFGQFAQTNKKQKIGFSYNGEQVVKPKYAKIVFEDDSIATAYLKDKIFYINQSGEKVYKGSAGNASPFLNGTGIVFHPKKGYQLLNRAGINLTDGQNITIEPKRFGSLVFVDAAIGALYLGDRVVAEDIDSVRSLESTLLVYHVSVRYVTVKKWKKLRRVEVNEPVYSPYFDLFNQASGQILISNGTWIRDLGKFNLIKSEKHGYHVLDKIGGLRYSGALKVDSLDQDYIVIHNEEGSVLTNINTWEVEIKGPYSKYEINDSSVYAYHTETNQLDIYVDNVLIQDRLEIINDWKSNDNVQVFKDESGVFFATKTGVRLTPSFEKINLSDKGYLRAGDKNCFTWIDAEGIQPLPFYFPVIRGQEYHAASSGNVLGRIIGAIFLRPNAGQGHSSYTDSLVLDEGHPFYEGYAVCSTNGKSSSKPFEEPYNIGKSSNLRYNYINTKGEFLSTKKYTDCFPFINGKAWVKVGSYYQLINNKGVRVGSLQFEKVKLDANGCFIVEKNNNEGIVDANYDYVVKCKYFSIHQDGKRYFSQFGSGGKLIYEAP